MEIAKPIVNLHEFDGLGLIVEVSSGVLYANQVAGLGCYQRQKEGVFVPLPMKPGRSALYALQQHFRGGWASLTEQDAHVIDGILRSDGYNFLRVDGSLLGESYEAWVHVLILAENGNRDLDLVHGFKTDQGVLTWLNSD